MLWVLCLSEGMPCFTVCILLKLLLLSWQSVQHENTYRDPIAKYCYGEYPPELLPVWELHIWAAEGRNWRLKSKRARQQLLLCQSLSVKSLSCMWGQTQRWREEVRNLSSSGLNLAFFNLLCTCFGVLVLCCCQCILWILPLNFRNHGVNLGYRTSSEKYLMWLCSCKWRCRCVSAVQRLPRVTVVTGVTAPFREQSMPAVLLYLEPFWTCMVYTTYVIMNYSSILYGSLAGSMDALHS